MMTNASRYSRAYVVIVYDESRNNNIRDTQLRCNCDRELNTNVSVFSMLLPVRLKYNKNSHHTSTPYTAIRHLLLLTTIQAREQLFAVAII